MLFLHIILLQDSSSWAGGAKGAVTARRSTTHAACARCYWKALGQRDFAEGEETPSATHAYGGYCSSGQKDPALPKTTLCFGVHSFQANNTFCCSPQTSKFSLHTTFEMQ